MDRVFLAPGERADLIIDFAGLEGSDVVLKNDTLPVMQFRVGRSVSQKANALPQSLRPVPQTCGVRSHKNPHPQPG